MTRWVVLMLFLCSACGRYGKARVPIVISDVDEKMSVAFNELQEELGEGILTRGPSGFPIISDADLMRSLFKRNGTNAFGFWSQKRVVILPPDTEIAYTFLPSDRVKYALAHELGHAAGLNHQHSGLMGDFIDESCLGRESECFIQALEAAGADDDLVSD